ncbi:Aep2p KNAG_0J00230 [Huiozyma naganishii CBS 8797]|uniref:ATPase expression protein 2, mitochondrial n=1 Tax=Huiozyma naganishii (strain ATCC MYA-139 / BCRC 22969 / CBS 8797 / KCTC 17520 / NBRC 10181 / NCYC 3082 / Yp74L-3) TaxID=1071383 RepID=J7SAF0_HUIN7|nr:hypothetical protein KNAG_0J00230 [Kazachstania naganishii CBS 8797]CCK72106.1 hypothetical protein KNAG_0J00230 [Kazachstania naganishii CBS 8797]
MLSMLSRSPVWLKIPTVTCNRVGYSTLRETLQTKNRLINDTVNPQENSQGPNIHKCVTNKYPASNNLSELLDLLAGHNVFNILSPTAMQFSVLLNRVLASQNYRHLDSKENVEKFFAIFMRYKGAIALQSNKLTQIQLHDFNLMCDYFIACNQLKKAQLIMDFLLQQDVKFDVFMIKNYTKLRCGSSFGKQTLNNKAYKVFDQNTVFQLIGKVEADRKFAFWNNEIVSSLGYTNNITLMEIYIWDLWRISIHDHSTENIKIDHLQQGDAMYPSSKVLATIVSSYARHDQTMKRAVDIVERFAKSYPKLLLNVHFWSTLLNCAIKCGGSKDPSQFLACWNLMKKWHTQRSKLMPFQSALLVTILRYMRQTSNLHGTVDILQYWLGPLYLKRGNIPEFERDVLIKYQKQILRKLVDKRKYNWCTAFIDQWSIDASNKEDLEAFYESRVDVRESKTRREKAYDDMDDDEDMIIGRLW